MHNQKSRGIAIILAIFLGGVGAHRFYLGQMTAGVLMLLFFWTLIPAIIAIIDIVRYLVMGEAKFQRRYSSQISNDNQGTSSSISDLEKLAALKEKGFLTEDEFNQKKKQIL